MGDTLPAYHPFDLQTEVTNQQRKIRLLAVVALVSLIAAGAIAIAFGLYAKNHSGSKSGNDAPSNPALDELKQEMSAAIDPTVDPCTDFYQYACGNWLATHTISDDHSSVSKSFMNITDRNRALLAKILEEDWPVIGAFYRSCMDTASIDAAGTSALIPFMSLIDSISDKSSAMNIAGQLWIKLNLGGLFFGSGVTVDSKNPQYHAWQFSQGGLNMPAPSYYSAEANRTDAYKQHIARMLTLYGVAGADVAAAQVVAIEKAIADFTVPSAAMRDPFATYNKYSLAELATATPGVAWAQFFAGAGIDASAATILLDAPSFFTSLSNLLAGDTVTVEGIKAYFRYTLLHSTSRMLPTAFRDEVFDFYSRTLSGVAVASPRNLTCADATNTALSDILGRYFVARAFPAEAKAQIKTLIGMIEAAFGVRLNNVDWFDEATRTAAKGKLAKVMDLVGYPDVWTDYSSLTIQPATYFENFRQVLAFDAQKERAKLNQKTDRTEWEMSPPTVNAYYEPTLNTINFPAGILQPPFFSPDYPASVNLGAVGAVMGHELTHGFDDQGAQFDGDGKLTKWWSDGVMNTFKQRTQCFVNQYSQFKLWDKNVNGSLTLGENLADNGGLRTAYAAYKTLVAQQGEEPAVLPKYTNDQVFFLSFAQVWCTKRRKDLDLLYLETDPHSPPFARVNGAVSNIDSFADAFKCKAGTPMNRGSASCVVW